MAEREINVISWIADAVHDWLSRSAHVSLFTVLSFFATLISSNARLKYWASSKVVLQLQAEVPGCRSSDETRPNIFREEIVLARTSVTK